MGDLSKRECGLKSCKPSTILHSRLPSRVLKSGPTGSHFDIRQIPEYRQYQVRDIVTSTPQAGSLRAPRHRQDSRSCVRSSKESRVQLEHLGPRCEDPTYRVLVSEFPQGSHLQAHADNASSLKGFQGLCISPLQKPNCNPGSCKPYQNDEVEKWPNARGPGQGNAAFRSRAMNITVTDAELNGCNPPGAPRVGTVPLPPVPWKQEADQHLAYNGPAMSGGRLTGTSDGGPTPLSHLDLEVTLPVPFTWYADAR